MAPGGSDLGEGMTTKPKPPRDLLKEHEGERLHEAVEGLLRHALGVAALRAQAGLGLARAASAPQIPARGGGKAQTPRCAPRLWFVWEHLFTLH